MISKSKVGFSGGDIAVGMVHGSHLYGTDTESSDRDYKGIFIPNSPTDILLGRAPKHFNYSTGGDGKNSKEDVDVELFSLHNFFEMCHKGEMVAIDMLHTPDEFLVNHPKSTGYSYLWGNIRRNRSRFYSKDMKAYLGYIRKQVNKYGLKGTRLGALEEVLDILKEEMRALFYDSTLVMDVSSLPINEYCYWEKSMTPAGEQNFYVVLGKKFQDSSKMFTMYDSLQKTFDKYGERAKMAKNNEGVDWKAVSHAARAAYQLLSIYKEGDIIFPLKEKDILLDIKKGKLDFDTEAAPLLYSLMEEVEVAAAASEYPDKLSKDWWEYLVVDHYTDIIL